MTDITKSNEQQKDDAISALESFQETIGWKIIVKALEANIRESEAKLHGDIQLEDGETIKSLQDQRNDRVCLRDLPKELIEEYKDKEAFPKELDPYE